jgi:hypothetical protein
MGGAMLARDRLHASFDLELLLLSVVSSGCSSSLKTAFDEVGGRYSYSWCCSSDDGTRRCPREMLRFHSAPGPLALAPPCRFSGVETADTASP